ncbi:hypothetical protein [Actinosynnema sp.]|uniref:hypothetical protein n=1 Tax=Actinosynnema sp. TaxID=1872144 RepID=UPI003F8262CC
MEGTELNLSSGKSIGQDMVLVHLTSTTPESPSMLPQLETVTRAVLDNITGLPA